MFNSDYFNSDFIDRETLLDLGGDWVPVREDVEREAGRLWCAAGRAVEHSRFPF